MGLNLATLLDQAGRRHADRIALRVAGRTVTYAELDEASRRFAVYLRDHGLRPRMPVGLMLPNCAEFPVAYFGALRAGGVIVPMNVMLREREVSYYLRDSGARFLIAEENCAEVARAAAADVGLDEVIIVGEGEHSLDRRIADRDPEDLLVQHDPEEPAVILYTSGTTGRPKGALLTHSNLLWNAEVSSELHAIVADDTLLGTLPLFHSFGQTCVLNAGFRRGAEVALMPRFEAAEALDLIERLAVTVFIGVPTMYVGLLAAADGGPDISSLRLCVSGGAAIAVEVLREFEERFGCRVLEGYGLSETSPVASFNHLDRPSKPGSIGTPIWGTEMRVVDETGKPLPAGEVGEIMIRGHHVMAGYHGRPEESAAAVDAEGWLHTGDLAKVDGDGYFFIVDRKKDLVIRGGYNVYPREVEEVLYEHPLVMEAAVLGVPDEALGEEVVAAVALRAGAEIESADLRDWIRERVAPYKYPRRVAIVSELPKGPTGKILKREIPAGIFAAAEA